MAYRPHETTREKKIRWFHAGARDFAVSVPQAIAQLGDDPPPVYCCPLCAKQGELRVFPEAAIDEKTLTFDHVPARHSGGRPLVLTCKICNSGAGHSMDIAALEVERGLSFLAGKGPGFARLHDGGDSFSAMMTWGAKEVSAKMFPNNPERIESFQKRLSGPGDRTFQVTFEVRDPSDRLALTSWLKSAYLAMFALFGYRYALSPALDIVRKQIQEPTVEHIPTFSIRLTAEFPFTQCRVFFTPPDAELPRSWCVLMGPILVLLPGDNSGRLYAQLQERKKQGGSFRHTATKCHWPTQPLFALAHRFKQRESNLQTT